MSDERELTPQQAVVLRLPDGKFAPGVSGNPFGPHRKYAEVRKAARMHGPRAIERLAELIESADGFVAIAACKELLDRGYGKAKPGGAELDPPQGIDPSKIPQDKLDEALRLAREIRKAVTPDDGPGVH